MGGNEKWEERLDQEDVHVLVAVGVVVEAGGRRDRDGVHKEEEF
jgi:hypothetical protein